MEAMVMSLGVESIEITQWDICLRLVCAMVIGLVIGMERENTHRPAGMRTHILVALGSCVVMILGQLIFVQYRSHGAIPDPARLGAQVISGISFLGAGTILREGVNVKGLTTAASLWTVACLGLAAGGGYYMVAIVGMVLVFITLTAMEVLQRRIFGDQQRICFVLESADDAATMRSIAQHSAACGMTVCRTQVQRREAGDSTITVQLSLRALQTGKKAFRFTQKMLSDPTVRQIRQVPLSEAQYQTL